MASAPIKSQVSGQVIQAAFAGMQACSLLTREFLLKCVRLRHGAFHGGAAEPKERRRDDERQEEATAFVDEPASR